ncbi:MAG: hypothetical protein AAGK32_16950, partial [Actinomycetota bacterium]
NSEGDHDDEVAVGILLIAFGAVTLLFARHPTQHLPLLLPYLTIKTVLWVARLGLEIVFPVRLSMFGIDPFTLIVTPRGRHLRHSGPHVPPSTAP